MSYHLRGKGEVMVINSLGVNKLFLNHHETVICSETVFKNVHFINLNILFAEKVEFYNCSFEDCILNFTKGSILKNNYFLGCYVSLKGKCKTVVDFNVFETHEGKHLKDLDKKRNSKKRNSIFNRLKRLVKTIVGYDCINSPWL